MSSLILRQCDVTKWAGSNVRLVIHYVEHVITFYRRLNMKSASRLETATISLAPLRGYNFKAKLQLRTRCTLTSNLHETFMMKHLGRRIRLKNLCAIFSLRFDVKILVAW